MADTTRQQKEMKRLEDEAAKFAEVLETVLPAEGQIPDDRLPRAELAKCEGLIFTSVWKAGIGVGLESGHGLVISKRPSSPTGWSAPLLLGVAAGTLGATLGVSKVDSVILLETEESINAFSKDVQKFQTEMTGPFGMTVGGDQPSSTIDLGDGVVEKTYSIAAGVMADISMKAMKYAADASRNAALYGDVNPAAVLKGDVAPPPAMQKLYDALNKAIKEHTEGGKQ